MFSSEFFKNEKKSQTIPTVRIQHKDVPWPKPYKINIKDSGNLHEFNIQLTALAGPLSEYAEKYEQYPNSVINGVKFQIINNVNVDITVHLDRIKVSMDEKNNEAIAKQLVEALYQLSTLRGGPGKRVTEIFSEFNQYVKYLKDTSIKQELETGLRQFCKGNSFFTTSEETKVANDFRNYMTHLNESKLPKLCR